MKGVRNFSALLALVIMAVGPGCESLGELAGRDALGGKRTGKVSHGKMSWYSVKTNGGTQTASGERFSDSGRTAAHRSLPFGTRVEVTNLNNNKKAVVRITDRGPFIKGRIIDVSIGVARDLDFVRQGVVPCKVEVLR